MNLTPGITNFKLGQDRQPDKDYNRVIGVRTLDIRGISYHPLPLTVGEVGWWIVWINGGRGERAIGCVLEPLTHLAASDESREKAGCAIRGATDGVRMKDWIMDAGVILCRRFIRATSKQEEFEQTMKELGDTCLSTSKFIGQDDRQPDKEWVSFLRVPAPWEKTMPAPDPWLGRGFTIRHKDIKTTTYKKAPEGSKHNGFWIAYCNDPAALNVVGCVMHERTREDLKDDYFGAGDYELQGDDDAARFLYWLTTKSHPLVACVAFTRTQYASDQGTSNGGTSNNPKLNL